VVTRGVELEWNIRNATSISIDGKGPARSSTGASMMGPQHMLHRRMEEEQSHARGRESGGRGLVALIRANSTSSKGDRGGSYW